MACSFGGYVILLLSPQGLCGTPSWLEETEFGMQTSVTSVPQELRATVSSPSSSTVQHMHLHGELSCGGMAAQGAYDLQLTTAVLVRQLLLCGSRCG